MRKFMSNEKVIVGYDLGNDYSQISYCIADSKVETLSSVAGAEYFNIPTVLCKRENVNQWFYGKEAIRYAEDNHGILVKNLVQLAVEGEEVQIEGKAFDPVALLTLFVKRSLGMLSPIVSPDKIDALMITCENLNHRMLEVLNQVVGGLKIKLGQVSFQSHTESFYQYMIRQSEELWIRQSLLCDYRDNTIRIYRMECNRRTMPIVAFIDKEQYSFPSYEPMPEAESLRREKMERMDGELLELMTKVCENRMISSVYLIGEHYSEEWMKESLRFLCKGRRVFQGSNLYSKGACYGMQERLSASDMGKSHVFLGNDKLKANIGMRILRRGTDSYYALLDAGVNWFEAEHTMECYLQESNEIELRITPLIGKNGKLARIVLDDLAEGLTRLQIHLYLKEENRLVVEITDLGLGEIRMGTGHVWSEEIEIYE
uniref:DUF5716 family protein n=1 Tax=Acetatifactor sp. TaxID=1872090 RepID=UPI00405762E3